MDVKLLDAMGNDSSVVRAARISYNRETKGKFADAALIDYLIRHGHTSPFAHVVFTFSLEVPIFIARQLMRHHVGVAWNELSMRYTKGTNRGWINDERIGKENVELYTSTFANAISAYHEMLERGVPREVARAVLPVGMMTKLIMTANLRALMNIWEHRLTEEAQVEAREVVAKMADLVQDTKRVPITLHSWNFWREYKKNACKYDFDERRIMLYNYSKFLFDIVAEDGEDTMPHRERFYRRLVEEQGLG